MNSKRSIVLAVTVVVMLLTVVYCFVGPESYRPDKHGVLSSDVPKAGSPEMAMLLSRQTDVRTTRDVNSPPLIPSTATAGR